LTLYTKALETEPDNLTLYVKMSLCSLHTGDKGKALDDAGTYKGMQPNLSKSCYAQGAALILVKEYVRACETLMSGLHLDFGSKPTEIAYRLSLYILMLLITIFVVGTISEELLILQSQE